MTTGRVFSAVLFAATVSGCAGTAGYTSLPFADRCPPPTTADDFENVDWSRARIVEVRVRQGEFTPGIIRLHQGNAYTLRINNRDDEVRRYLSPAFFHRTKVESIVIGDTVVADTCLAGLVIPPLTVAQVRFIAERDGRYEVEDTALPLPFAGAPSGLVVVEQALPKLETVLVLPPPSSIPVFKPNEGGQSGATPAAAAGEAAPAPGAQPKAPVEPDAPSVQTIRRKAPDDIKDKLPPPPAKKPAEGGGLFGQ